MTKFGVIPRGYPVEQKPRPAMTESELAVAMKKLAFAEGHRKGTPKGAEAKQGVSHPVSFLRVMDAIRAEPGKSSRHYAAVLGVRQGAIPENIARARKLGWVIETISLGGNGADSQFVYRITEGAQ